MSGDRIELVDGCFSRIGSAIKRADVSAAGNDDTVIRQRGKPSTESDSPVLDTGIECFANMLATSKHDGFAAGQQRVRDTNGVRKFSAGCVNIEQPQRY